MTDTYVKIDLEKMGKNAKSITSKYSEYDYYIGVVKGDGYGHSMKVVNPLYENGINYFAVSSIEEARDLRKENKDVPVLCLEPIMLSRIDEAEELKLTLVVHELDYLNELLKLDISYSFKLHIQVDSGFNRLGFKDKEEIKKAYDLINESKFTLEGIYQHFATSGIFDKRWDNQVEKFKELTSLIDLSTIPMVHFGSGVALLGHKKIDIATTTRMGLLMYGYNIGPQTYGSGLKNQLRTCRDSYYRKKYDISEVIKDVDIDLYPAMSLHTRILQIKDVKKGEAVGYNASYIAEDDIKIAVLPVGYNNGIGHQNNGRMVEINDKLYPVIGEIGMNMLVIKIDDSVKSSDEVTLLGGKITLGMFSSYSGLTLAEVLLGVGKNNIKEYI